VNRCRSRTGEAADDEVVQVVQSIARVHERDASESS